MFSTLSLPPQLSCSGHNEGGVVVVPLDGGRDGHPVEGHGVIAGGGEDELGYLLRLVYTTQGQVDCVKTVRSS